MPTTMLQPNDVVQVTNLDTSEWTGMYNSQKYKMAPGGKCIAPFIAVCHWFGHPNAVDIDARNRYRTDEYARLRVVYGVYDDEDKFQSMIPHVEVHDLEGNKIITVLDDPRGDNLTPESSTVAEKQQLEIQMEAMRRQMMAMQAQMNQHNTALGLEDPGDLATTDDAPELVNPHVLTPEQVAAAEYAAEPTPSTGVKAPAVSAQPSEDVPTRVKVSS